MAEDFQRTFRARLSSCAARVVLNRTAVPRRAPSYAMFLKFFWKILPLQAVDNFVRADVKTHIWPIVAVDRDRNLNLPTWKFFDEPLQLTDDGRPQTFSSCRRTQRSADIRYNLHEPNNRHQVGQEGSRAGQSVQAAFQLADKAFRIFLFAYDNEHAHQCEWAYSSSPPPRGPKTQHDADFISRNRDLNPRLRAPLSPVVH